MKRTVVILSLIFAMAIALSASIPTLADSQSTSGTTVSGTLAKKAEISASTASVNLGALPNEALSAVVVTVKCNTGWTLTALAPKMQDTATTPNVLTNALEGRKSAGSYQYLDTTAKTMNSGLVKTSASGVPTTIDFQQTIVDYEDVASGLTYSTLVTFTVNY